MRRKNVRTWNEIFGILFPNDDEDSYPPQCKFIASFTNNKLALTHVIDYQNTECVRLLDRFSQYYRQQIPRVVPQILAGSPTLQDLTEDQQARLTAELPGIVNDIHTRIVRSYRRDLGNTPTSGEQASMTTRVTSQPPPHPAFRPGTGAEQAPRSLPLDTPQAADLLDPVRAFEVYLYSVAPEGVLDGPAPPHHYAPESGPLAAESTMNQQPGPPAPAQSVSIPGLDVRNDLFLAIQSSQSSSAGGTEGEYQIITARDHEEGTGNSNEYLADNEWWNAF